MSDETAKDKPKLEESPWVPDNQVWFAGSAEEVERRMIDSMPGHIFESNGKRWKALGVEIPPEKK